ncbi:Fanconi anemia group I protein [Athalia rosae]|uniref:Fanconi anemia group I protein n=1 Tax=Athalia rosae TaxID=37344 RepID=UPI002033B671|nr:Fanconi anemia group I protein [Athalia rosae]
MEAKVQRLYANIKALANKEDHKQLQELIVNTKEDELCGVVTTAIHHVDPPKLLMNLLGSFNSTTAQTKRLCVVQAILVALKTAKITNADVNTIICGIVMDFSKYSSPHLIKLVEFCQQSIIDNDDVFMSWKDILPQLLEVLEDRNVVNNNGNEISGKDYKELVLKALYSGQWDSAVLPSLTTMFREISMSKEEHGKIVRLLCNRLSKMEPNELPPLVHQLLALCRHQNAGIVIVALSKYFKEQYEKVANEDSQEFSEDIVALSLKDIQEVESTILYHISQAAKVNQNSLKDYLKALRAVTNLPEYVLDPFVMTLLLSVSDIFEEESLELLKLGVNRIIRDTERQKHSAWLKEVLDKNCSLSTSLATVIENSIKDRHMVVKGLVDLAFMLMGVGVRWMEESYMSAAWDIGNRIIQKLIKKRQEIGSTVLQALNDKIMSGGASVTQYTNCLAQICKKVPLVVFECQGWIISLVEQLSVINGNAASQVIFAILPIVHFRTEIRDTLSIVLRKALYSRKTETREMAVIGYLQLLKNFKINSLGALSQSANYATSSSSSYTQASLENHGRRAETNPELNAVLCYEVLGILKRCFTQQAEVKLCLYDGLANVIQMNPELSTYLIDMLLEHFKCYYEPDQNILPPLKLEKCTTIRGAESVLQEPIGNLILTMQKIYVKSASEDSSDVENLGFILESLCNRMAKSELHHFQLEDCSDLLDNVPESQEKLHNLKQMITVYEALIAYRIVTWTKESVNPAHKVYLLFEGYNRLIARTKPMGKAKKGEGKKKKDKDVTDATFKKPGRAHTLKLSPTILDLDTISKVVSLLYSEAVPWSSREEAAELREKELFHCYILQTCIQLIQRTKQLKNNDVQKHLNQDIIKCFEIGQILYTRVLSKFDEIRSFDRQTAVLGVECFKELCDLACSTFPGELVHFLTKAGNVNPNMAFEGQLMNMISLLKDLLISTLDEDENDEVISKKISLTLMSTLSPLILKLPSTSDNIQEILKWLHELATNQEMEGSLAVAIIQLILKVEEYTLDYGESIDKIVSQLCQTLGMVMEEEVPIENPYKVINELSGLQIHSVICTTLKHKLDDASWFLGRLKAEHMLSTMPGMDLQERREVLKEKERQLGYQLYLIAKTLETLTNVAVHPGPNAEAVFKNLQNLYSTLSMFTKYFYNKSTAQNPVFQAVRFIPVVKLAGKSLAKTLYNFITHIEENQKTKSKTKIVDAYAQRSKVLKETKIIPKVIYEIEQFGKHILLLGKKTKIPLEEYVQYSITRDFRIKNPALMKGLEALDVSMLDTQSSHLDLPNTGDLPNNTEVDLDTSPPPSKKKKKASQSQK